MKIRRNILESNTLESNILESNILESNILESNILESDILESNILESDILARVVLEVLALELVVLSVIAVFLRSNIWAANTEDVEGITKQYQQETKCEHVSVIVYDHGYTSYYGDSDALYQIGSMTKAFTGLAIQKLIEEGLVNEDGVVSDYIPGFSAYYASESVDITVRNLLEQKSGYTNNEKDYPSATETMKLSEWADSISGCELKSKPGTEYAYSNVNYNLLGLIIENVSGKSYSDYMEQEILISLGLNNTYVGVPADSDRIVEGTRIGYRRAFSFPMPVREATIPAGYFYSDSEDMGRWIEIWTENGDVPENLRGPLSKIKKQLQNEGDYYSGWELFENGVIGHSGGTPNYSSRIVFDDEKEIGVCVLSNLNVAASTDSLCNSIFDTESGKTPTGISTDIWTIFDKIFSLVTIICILLLVAVIFLKKRAVLITFDVIMAVLLVTILILFPIIFGAGMKAIVFTWAPWSLAGGLVSIAILIASITIKLLLVKKYADHKKRGEGQASDDHN